MALIFISIGLNDEKDMSLNELEAAKSCDRLFLELYTSKLETDKSKLEKLIGKDVKLVKRKDLEEEYKKILSEAKSRKIGILIGGDCLVSTAHAALMTEARKEKIEVKIIHGSSILSAVAESGLHIPKFGQMVTIPFHDRTKGTMPVSVYNAILGNRIRGLHTLCLLDMIAEENRFMSVREAVKILFDLEKEVGKKIIDKKTEGVVFSRLGSEDEKIVYGKLEELAKIDFAKPPYCLAIIGKLHFSEKESLENY